MKSKWIKWFCKIGIFVGFLTALYIGLSVYYNNGFSFWTWINGMYCTGKTVEQVNAELIAGDELKELQILLPDGKSETLILKDIDYKIDYTEDLNRLMEQQHPWKWYENILLSATGVKLEPIVSFEEERLKTALQQMEFVKKRKPDDAYTVRIEKRDTGYQLINERENVLHFERCAEQIRNAVYCRNKEINLVKSGCYTDLPLTTQMQDVIKLWEKLDAYQTCEISYQFGDSTEKVDASVVCNWIAMENNEFLTDESGEFITDKEKVRTYIDTLGDKYDTVGGTRQFHSTRGTVITVEGGTYGNLLDRDTETEYLYQAFCEKRKEIREPVYIQEAWQKGLNDIGDTYIEIDMGRQQLYYYVDGELVLDTPIVTGNVKRGRNTPAMVCYIYAKQKNRVLRGPGYASPVKFWMPVKGGIGIHDARWRDEFGGDIYLTDGSHGCINLPLEKAEHLYGLAEIGTPVVMFYD